MMKDIYDAIYELRVGKETEKGWHKLIWRPIWKGTYSFYILTPWWSSFGSFWNRLGTWFKHTHFGFGISGYRSDATNGWGRSYKHGHIMIRLFCITINFWIAWKFHVMAKGPQDVANKDKKRLDIYNVKFELKKKKKFKECIHFMGTKAYHFTGDISSDEYDLFIAGGETKKYYIGNWVEGMGFADVLFPKETSRKLTQEEIDKYNKMNYYINSTNYGKYTIK